MFALSKSKENRKSKLGKMESNNENLKYFCVISPCAVFPSVTCSKPESKLYLMKPVKCMLVYMETLNSQ